ncbi:N-acyl-D-amino-acid deacylase [Sphingopyxis sp. YR583]|uniref:N-acyl-D-amino-acid deacylase family protein n=1 Tax=Sphingopyxis sp. YR583 TaxID=1881047 RepID=UPI0008A78184|nr:D-aminoacylase [Sphingopyxis sp. YR583]SEH10795.1 N-acyl-D-amino-acid deacylase [Sphingopyxis sp. YR583]
MALRRSFAPSLMLLCSSMLLPASVAAKPAYDLIIRGGTIYDGSGKAPVVGDVAIKDDRIVAVGKVDGTAKTEVTAKGMAVAPGFINMLSWATESLIADPKSQSDIRQGVTLEVMGEGWSMGPMNATMKRLETERQGDIKYPIEWTSLGDYFNWLEKRGVSTNIASFVGAATVRVHELGEGDVDPDPEQLARMRTLVKQAMNDGAMGVGSSIIYAPGSYAETDELVALTSEAAKCGGMYISHMRSEGDRIEEAVDELIDISRRSGAPAEIYHLKMAGRSNWGKLDTIVKKIEDARAEGLKITTDMYTYTAGATGLDAAMPTWVQAGGLEKWIERLKDPAIRARVAAEMKQPGNNWENLYFGAGADKMILSGFKNDALKPLTGKTLAEVAAMRGKSPEETAMDLVVEDGSRVGTVYFLMSEDNVRKQIQLPWMSFGSDAASQAAEGVFLKSGAHPRTYGNFSRLLGRYVRDEKLISLEQAVYRLTTLPASNLGIKDRGALKPGYYADVVVFDPATIGDRSTFEKPHQYSVGMRDVFVNGVGVLRNGEHSGATPGRAVRGAGWNRCS